MTDYLKDITVFDIETTGLDPDKNQIIEIAAIRVFNGNPVSEFSTLVACDHPLDPKITEITGLTNRDLEGAMSIDTAFKIFLNMSKTSTLVAHNASFDLSFLNAWLKKVGAKEFYNPFIDTLAVCRYRNYYPHTMSAMLEKYGIEMEGEAHRAMNDVRALLKLFNALNEEKDVSEWVNKMGYLKRYGPPKWVPNHAELVPMVNKYK